MYYVNFYNTIRRNSYRERQAYNRETDRQTDKQNEKHFTCVLAPIVGQCFGIFFDKMCIILLYQKY